MKFQLCYIQSDYFGQMKSNTASFNSIRRIDIAEFFSDRSALKIKAWCHLPFGDTHVLYLWEMFQLGMQEVES